jgi:hypothetical protein
MPAACCRATMLPAVLAAQQGILALFSDDLWTNGSLKSATFDERAKPVMALCYVTRAEADGKSF